MKMFVSVFAAILAAAAVIYAVFRYQQYEARELEGARGLLSMALEGSERDHLTAITGKYAIGQDWTQTVHTNGNISTMRLVIRLNKDKGRYIPSAELREGVAKLVKQEREFIAFQRASGPPQADDLLGSLRFKGTTLEQWAVETEAQLTELERFAAATLR